MAQAQIPEY